MLNYKIEELKENEYHYLEEFIYHAIFQKEDAEKLPRNVIYNSDVYIYIDSFKKESDNALCIKVDDDIIGIVWTRHIKAFGYISDDIPEFAISLLPEYRNKGLGTILMEAMIKLLKEKNYQYASLAVQKENYARKMYQKLGFKTIKETNEEYIMLIDLNEK